MHLHKVHKQAKKNGRLNTRIQEYRWGCLGGSSYRALSDSACMLPASMSETALVCRGPEAVTWQVAVCLQSIRHTLLLDVASSLVARASWRSCQK